MDLKKKMTAQQEEAIIGSLTTRPHLEERELDFTLSLIIIFFVVLEIKPYMMGRC